MAVNPASVIPTWLNSYWPEVYVALTNQEDSSYTNQGTAFWQPLFSQLAGGLTAWQSSNREPSILNFMLGTYGYLVTGLLYGTDTSIKAQMNGQTLNSCGGFLPAVLTRPVDYYDDITVDPMDPTATPFSPRMNADLATVAGGAAADVATIAAVTTSTQGTIQRHMYDQLFQTLPIVGHSSKAILATTYFIDLNWKHVYQNLNVGTLTVPPGV